MTIPQAGYSHIINEAEELLDRLILLASERIHVKLFKLVLVFLEQGRVEPVQGISRRRIGEWAFLTR